MNLRKDPSHENKIFVKVLGVKANDIKNWLPLPATKTELADNDSFPRNGFVSHTAKPTVSTQEHVGKRTEKGYLVEVNDELIAIFKVQNKIYAIQDSCPHAGGPLSMGDIEELPAEGLCIVCPWHQFKILLRDGSIGERKGRPQFATIYPVIVTEDDEIYIGFDQLSRKYFDIELHSRTDMHVDKSMMFHHSIVVAQPYIINGENYSARHLLHHCCSMRGPRRFP